MRAPLLALLMLSVSLAGCLGGETAEDMGDADLLLAPAEWQRGQWWLYTFSTPDWEDDSARLVVTETDAEDGTAFMLGIDSRREAQRHAVLNHNPFLGRITHDNLSAFENGEPTSVLTFPLETGNTWAFTLFGIDWTTRVVGTHGAVANLQAESADGQHLDYTYDGRLGFFASLTWRDASEAVVMSMTSVRAGHAYSGDVFFIRAGDIFAKEWDHDSGAPDVEITDSFFVSGHPSQGDYDQLIYWLDARMGGGSSTGTLTLRDHNSVTALSRQWGPGIEENGQIGTIPYPSGEYTLTLTQSGDSYVRLIVAGGIVQTWQL